LDIVSPENLVLEEGKSSELAQSLALIRETQIDDVDKYTEKTCRELARIIVCRTYAPVIHELCHLVVIAAHHGSPSGRYEELFWDTGAARGHAFQAHLAARPADGSPVVLDGGEARIGYAGKPFAVSFGRMPLLSALLEFLMTALGYTDMDAALARLLGEVPNAAQVSGAANDLSRRLYAYLQDHLPPVQAQKKNRSFLAFAAERADGALTAQSLGDDLILDYWIAQTGDDGDNGDDRDDETLDVDARTYKGVFDTAARLIRILRYAEEKYRMGAALPIGTDRETGEVDPAALEDAIGDIEGGEGDSADPLGEAASRLGSDVKFLNKRELGVLGEAVHDDGVARTLPRSILRTAVFGHAQSRLTQAMRGKSGDTETAALIEALPDTDYAMRIADYRALDDHMDRMALASLHVLARAGHKAAISLALGLRPELDLGGLAPDPDAPDAPDWNDANVVSFQAATAGRRFFDQLSGDGDLGRLGDDAAAAFKAVSRKGFAEVDLADKAVIAFHAEGAAALLDLRAKLAGFLNAHAEVIDWSRQFDTDKPVFRRQFNILYGGRNG